MEKFYKSNWLFNVRKLAIAAALIFSGSLAMAQLSGTYTIDSSMATSGTNFASFTDFADTITTYGVSGAVTVNVVANSGPYNENFELTAINNTSSTNTVTINGNGNTISASGWVVEFDGADYVTIDNLVINANGTSNGTGGVWLHNSSNNNTISNCEIIVSAFTGTTTGTAYVWLSNSSTSLTSGTHGINNVFEDNYMWGGGTSGVGPYYGVAEYRSSSSTTSNTILDGNEIRDVYYYYTYFYYSRNVQVIDNDLHTNRVGSPNNYGFYNYYGYKSTYNGNQVHDMDPSSYMYVSYLYYCYGTSSDYSTYSNNEFYNLESNYIYYNRIYYSDYTNVENNQVYDNEASSYNYYGYYIYYSDYNNIINNTFTNNESGNYNYYGYYLYYSTNCELIDNKFTKNKASNYNYYGFYVYYSGNTTVQGNEYGDNSANYNYYGFYLYQSTNLDVLENKYYGNAATYNYYAFYTYYCANSDIKYNEYYGNKGDYCYYAWMLYYSDNSVVEGNVCRDNNPNYYLGYIYYVYESDNSYIINNLYYGNDPGYANYYTLYLGYSDPVVFAHNTFIVDNNVDYYHYNLWYIYYYNTPNDVQVKNNIMYIDGSSGYGYHYPIYVYYNADQIDWGYNVWWDISPTTTKYHYANATTYNTFTLWMEAAGDETSVIANPMFANMAGGDFTPTNPEIANMGEPGLATLDFNKDTRTACGPDPGALEFFIDHSASNLVFNGTNECGNYMEEISIDFNNGTSVDMEDVEMFYTINGTGKVSEYIDEVKANSSVTHTFAKIPTFNTPGNNTLTVGLGCDDDASNNTISHNIFITPSPSGGDLVEGATWNGYWNTGNTSDPDVTVPSEVSVYEIVSPSKYNNGEYGTKWTMTHNTMTSGGMTVGAAEGFTFSAPAGSNSGKITVDPDVSLTDSLVYVSVVINDLVTGCDSTIGRWMYIPFTPNPDFVPNNVCFGDVSQNQNTSTMGGKDVMAFKWKFGDPNDAGDSLEAKLGVWQYSSFGTFDVTLEVVNFTYPKFVYSVTKQVTILPTPEINFQIVNACEGTDIQFINNTTLPVPGNISYVWNFGDGAPTTTVKNPSHLYASAKAEGYIVTLKAEANGRTSEESKKAYQ
ncbi:PKD domain-containing protein, partial [bacterium]|nr:PKD domain-containing protein [bacterium]